MSIKILLMKKMLASKMKNIPQTEQDKFFSILEKNPDLFQKIALEVQEEVKKGKDQMSAMMNIAKKYEVDIKNLL